MALKFPEVRQIAVKTGQIFLKNHPKFKEFEFNVHYVDAGGGAGMYQIILHYIILY